MAIKDAFKNLIGIPSDEYYNDNEDINETNDDFVDSPMISAVNNQKKDKVVNVFQLKSAHLAGA